MVVDLSVDVVAAVDVDDAVDVVDVVAVLIDILTVIIVVAVADEHPAWVKFSKINVIHIKWKTSALLPG